MERCEFCDNILVALDAEDYSHSTYCNGERYLQEDPFLSEIRGDTTLYMLCDGEAYLSYMET